LIVQSPGVRVIATDRPGYGISDPKPDRALIDWPSDVLELADHLGIDSFAVAGESGGCPHALACAYGCPSRVTRALLLASPSPADFKGVTQGMSLGNRLGIVLNRYAPWLIRQLMRGNASAFKKNPDRFVDALAAQVSAPDKAYRQGSEAQIQDAELIAASEGWGFKLSEVSVPVFMWYGDADTLVSNNMAERLAREIPQCTYYHVPQAGHLLSDHSDVIKQFRAALRGEPM
jgi:pimeloyl-ACP methyl ester carboxylesterase